MSRLTKLSPLILLCVFFCPANTRAEPLDVKLGSVTLEGFSGIEFTLRGGNFFFGVSGSAGPDRQVIFDPGDSFDLSAGVGQTGTGFLAITVNGVEYDRELTVVDYSLDFRSASFTLPAGGERFITQAPFTFTGTFTGTQPTQNGPQTVFSVTLRGRGIARALLFDTGGPGNTRFLLNDQTYIFQPIPVPTTMLLLGTGLAGLGGVIRRSRQGKAK